MGSTLEWAELKAKAIAEDFQAELDLHWKIVADLHDALEHAEEGDEKQFYESMINGREAWIQQTIADFRAWRARLIARYHVEVPDLPDDLH